MAMLAWAAIVAIRVASALQTAAKSELADDEVMLTQTYPFYHTSDELDSEVRALAASCSGAQVTMEQRTDSGMTIDVVRVTGSNATVVNKVFILFGEHSRELISPESGLVFLKMLCGRVNSNGAVDAAAVLERSEFMLVLNGNPLSRRKVEAGEYCLRANENGVDLNRNWDAKWQADPSTGVDTNPGPEPFSEPETRIFRDLVTEYRPDTFMTIHSGTYGMYMPWAYDTEHMGNRNRDAMLDMLENVDARHCECPFGAAGKEVGYACPGTCLDYVYDVLLTPFAFAFEIYTSPEYEGVLKSRWEEKVASGGSSLIQGGGHLAHPHFHDLFQQHKSDFVHIARRASLRGAGSLVQGQWPQDVDCFVLFNPTDEEAFNFTTVNWASAYLEIAALAAERLLDNQTSSSS